MNARVSTLVRAGSRQSIIYELYGAIMNDERSLTRRIFTSNTSSLRRCSIAVLQFPAIETVIQLFIGLNFSRFITDLISARPYQSSLYGVWDGIGCATYCDVYERSSDVAKKLRDTTYNILKRLKMFFFAQKPPKID